MTTEVAEVRGRLSVPHPVPAVDGLLAATALVHDLTLVTRDVKDVERTDVRVLGPFEGPGGPRRAGVTCRESEETRGGGYGVDSGTPSPITRYRFDRCARC